ncbi:YfcE family phosphodiesterase [Anaerovirgula multivorans]|uniref:YfcE family phosphodiesterase n=1 Tax=Anaerovirgula multivorans TaxID=312168 RepID=UPI001FA8B475
MNKLKVVVLGDSHRDTSSIDMIGDVLKEAELVIHNGDNYKDLVYIQDHYNPNAIGVRGNCDLEESVAEERLEIIEDKRVFITHGHRYGVKYGLSGIFYKGKELKADLVIFGHSHMPVNLIEDGMVLLNPGSVSLPRGNSTRSFASLEIKDSINVEIIELK